MNPKLQRISIDQVRVGLYIYLENWLNHPFLSSNFKIQNEKQIKVLRSLGLKEILYLPDKSDTAPLPLPKTESPVAPKEPAIDHELNHEIAALLKEKQERRQKIVQQHEAYQRCEKQFVSTISSVKGMLLNLFARPQESVAQAQALITDMVEALLAEKDTLIHLMNVNSSDDGAYYHSLNVTMLALMLGREAGLNPEEMRELGLGTLLHDIGKERVPAEILLKKTPWNTAERNFYRLHVAYGVEMSQKLPNLPQGVLEVISQHHEMLDGSGFPKGIDANHIGKLARIAAIANDFDNACNRIEPADSLTPAQALSVMFKKSSAKYDAKLIQYFVRCLGVYPPGSIVRLNNDAIALVVNVNPGKLLQPTLLLYDPGVPKEEAFLFNLADEPDLSIVNTLRPGQLPKAVFDYLSLRNRISYFNEKTDSTPSRKPKAP